MSDQDSDKDQAQPLIQESAGAQEEQEPVAAAPEEQPAEEQPVQDQASEKSVDEAPAVAAEETPSQ